MQPAQKRSYGAKIHETRKFSDSMIRNTVSFIVVAGATLIVLGCSSPEQRYKVLSFFFDGVPVPLSMRPVDMATAEGYDDTFLDRDEGLTHKETEEKKITYYHAPYTNKSCFGSCHDRNAGYGAVLEQSSYKTCLQCHSSYFNPQPDDWAHAPILLGDCRQCHLPHKSEYKGLLIKPQRDICFGCHDPGFMKEDPFHARVDDDTNCSTCHDPHGSGNRLLLIDSNSYRRRRGDLRKTLSEHSFKPPEECGICHDLTRSNARYENLEQKCLQCHEGITVPPDGLKMHEAVTEMACLTCHTPHKTPRPNLIRVTAEKICLNCHDLPHKENPRHPNITRGECLICHFGHTSERPMLLKPGVWLPGGENPMPEVELQQEQEMVPQDHEPELDPEPVKIPDDEPSAEQGAKS